MNGSEHTDLSSSVDVDQTYPPRGMLYSPLNLAKPNGYPLPSAQEILQCFPQRNPQQTFTLHAVTTPLAYFFPPNPHVILTPLPLLSVYGHPNSNSQLSLLPLLFPSHPTKSHLPTDPTIKKTHSRQQTASSKQQAQISQPVIILSTQPNQPTVILPRLPPIHQIKSNPTKSSAQLQISDPTHTTDREPGRLINKSTTLIRISRSVHQAPYPSIAISMPINHLASDSSFLRQTLDPGLLNQI